MIEIENQLVDEVIDTVQTSSTTEDNKLIKYGALFIIQMLRISNKKKNISLIEKREAEMLKKESHKARSNDLYLFKKKWYKREAEEFKQLKCC